MNENKYASRCIASSTVLPMFAEYYCEKYNVELDKIIDYENTVGDWEKCVDYRIYFKDGTSLDIANRVIFNTTTTPSFSMRTRENTDAEFIKMWEAVEEGRGENTILLIAFADGMLKAWLTAQYNKGVMLDKVIEKLKTDEGEKKVLKHIKQICGCPVQSYFDVYSMELWKRKPTHDDRDVSFIYIECAKVKELSSCYYDVYTQEMEIDLEAL